MGKMIRVMYEAGTTVHVGIDKIDNGEIFILIRRLVVPKDIDDYYKLINNGGTHGKFNTVIYTSKFLCSVESLFALKLIFDKIDWVGFDWRI